MAIVDVVDPLEVWGQSIRARLPGADEGAWLQELQNAVEEFCIRSLCMQIDLPITVAAGVADYPLNPVDAVPVPAVVDWPGVQALYVHYAEFSWDGRPHFPTDYRPKYLYPNATSNPQTIYVVEPAVVGLFPVPGARLDGELFTVHTALVPKRPISHVPKMLADYYFEGVLDGAVGRMMGHSKRPYSDPRMAQYHMTRFRNAMRTAKDEALRRWGNAERSHSFNPDWSRSTDTRHFR